MPQIVSALAESGWRIVIVTRYDVKTVIDSRLLAQYPVEMEILSSACHGKGPAIAAWLKDHLDPPCEECFFVDDKPENLASVLSELRGAIRIIGFAGSGKYTQRLTNWCAENHVELAVSPTDLMKLLQFSANPLEKKPRY